jgi:hypothetical protein
LNPPGLEFTRAAWPTAASRPEITILTHSDLG